jgi:protein phosphatase
MDSEKTKFKITFGSMSDVGVVRTENQDSYGKYPGDSLDIDESEQLFIVADGMGGHLGGREASDIAVNEVQAVYFEYDNEDPGEKLTRAIEIANETIFHYAAENPNLHGMGTTCTALAIRGECAYIAHVGDSRAYLINSVKIEQLTRDHTKVAELLRQGIITEQDARYHPERSILYRALGTHPQVNVDVVEIPLCAGDYFLICSDGMSRLDSLEVQQIVLLNPPETACKKLVETANELDGEDNVTVQVIQVLRTSDT